jgi:hypothetical protein
MNSFFRILYNPFGVVIEICPRSTKYFPKSRCEGALALVVTIILIKTVVDPMDSRYTYFIFLTGIILFEK